MKAAEIVFEIKTSPREEITITKGYREKNNPEMKKEKTSPISLSRYIRKNKQNKLRVEAVGPECGPDCTICECQFKIRINRRWIEPDGIIFKKNWLQRFNRLFFNSTDENGHQNKEVIPNYNIYARPKSHQAVEQVRRAFHSFSIESS